jgi:GH24 family phage-related lysozyme (muramidase)
MADTIEGGAYQSADGSWHDANGQPLKAEQVKAAEKAATEQQAVTDADDARLMQAEANRDPVARALTAVMQRQMTPAAAAKDDK